MFIVRSLNLISGSVLDIISAVAMRMPRVILRFVLFK